ncbi:MAG TPA: hypothetical protein VKA38_05610, partial [Draconibacterium sp.]|nr:hypothetical protein [Draconibacterium sp.]
NYLGWVTDATSTNLNGHYVYTIKNENTRIKCVHPAYKTKELDFEGKKEINVQLEKKEDAVTFRGKVKNELGQPISEVLIFVKETLNNNTAYAVATNDQGEFSTNKNIENKTLIFKSPGYLPKEIYVGTQKSLHVQLKTNDISTSGSKQSMLNRKKRLPGAVNGIKLKNHKDPEKKPLFIVNGVKKEGIEDLPEEEIKSINVLKGDQAIQMYGDKGKNGVIIITTKTGNNRVDDKITTRLELRKFIANKIKFPDEARDEYNSELHMRFYATINMNGKITDVSEKPNGSAEIVPIEEIVVVAERDKNKIPEVDIQNGNLMAKEAIRVIKEVPRIDIPQFIGKTIELHFKFVLKG